MPRLAAGWETPLTEACAGLRNSTRRGKGGSGGFLRVEQNHAAFCDRFADAEATVAKPVCHPAIIQRQFLIIADPELPVAVFLYMEQIVYIDDIIAVIEEAGENLLVVATHRYKPVSAGWRWRAVVAERQNEASAGDQHATDLREKAKDGVAVRQMNQRVAHAHHQLGVADMLVDLPNVVAYGVDAEIRGALP